MTFSIETFRSQIEPLGYYKPSKFVVQLSVPPGFSGEYDFSFMNTTNRLVEFFCSNAVLPGLDFTVQPIRRYGYGAIEKKPWNPLFGECQLRIFCDAKGTQWLFFKKWMGMIINTDSSNTINTTNRFIGAGVGGSQTRGPLNPYEVSYKDDYISDVVIRTFDDAANEITRIHLHESYPISLSNINLDWGSRGDIATFLVNLTYRDWWQEDTALQQSQGASSTNWQTFAPTNE